MGSHSSKAAKGDVVGQEAAAPAAEAAGGASPSKSNGQENGHIKINGDVSPKADGEPVPLNGNGSAEPVKEDAKVESGNGDTIEPAPVAESGDAKSDGAAGAANAPKETPKKKKKFSFKKPFKLSGISFRKTKKDSADTSAVSSPTEEPRKEETKAEEAAATVAGETEQPGATKEEEKKQEEATTTVVASAPPSAPEPEAAAVREAGSEGQAEEPEKPQPAPANESPEEAKVEEKEAPKPAEVESSSAPVEQKEE